MSGITDLGNLLKQMSPRLRTGIYVFCSVESGYYGDFRALRPVASVDEDEGLTLVLLKEKADEAKLAYDSLFRMITLTVNSSLNAVGLTASFSTRLAEHGISANVIAGYYHDHIFVPEERADEALALLETITLS